MSDWVLLLPPSESKASPSSKAKTLDQVRKNSKGNAFPDLDPARDKVLEALENALQRGVGLDQLFESTGAGLDASILLNRALHSSPVMPARDLYTGVMYEAISFKTLKPAEKKLFETRTLIFSGLFGLVRPTDLIPPYKLKISANLGGMVGKLVQFWRRPVSEVLRKEVRGKVVWDFLPDQHKRVWDSTGEIVARHQVKFVKKVIRSGVAEYKTISHHSKSLKGSLVRHLLAKNASDPYALEDFRHKDGYRFSQELSVMNDRESLLVFSAD